MKCAIGTECHINFLTQLAAAAHNCESVKMLSKTCESVLTFHGL